METEKKLWYAVMTDREDTDHGTGSFDQTEAEAMLRRSAYAETGYIAVIDPADDYCIDEYTID